MEDIKVSASQAILLDLITDDQLAGMRVANEGNPEVVALIDARVEAKAKAENDAKALDDFKVILQKVELPNAPEGVINIYRAWQRQSRPLTNKEQKEVLAANPTLTEEIVSTRRIEIDKWAWGDWTFNKAMTTAKSTTSRATSTRKLAITLNKREGNALTPIGNFRTSKEACTHLGLETAGDSANRVLLAHKYITDQYEGTDFLVPEA